MLEMGMGGAKLEHAGRLDVGRVARFSCGPLSTEAEVRHSMLLPARTGVVYQSGISFTKVSQAENDLILGLLVNEAKAQVTEWESNLEGVAPKIPSRRAVKRSAVALRFVVLRHTPRGWEQRISKDPNQPDDGVTVVDGTPEEEIRVLKQTYDDADEAMRELMRAVATVAVLEQLREATSQEEPKSDGG